MKAINYLKQIKKLDSEINTAIEELAELEALATKTTSALGGERVQSSGSQDKMADCVVKIIERKNKLNADIDRLIDLKAEARQLICEACDDVCTELLHKRYFQKKSWEQIAVEMKYTYHWVSGGLHQRALTQLGKKLNERGVEDESRAIGVEN